MKQIINDLRLNTTAFKEDGGTTGGGALTTGGGAGLSSPSDQPSSESSPLLVDFVSFT